jgi:hypothetical protein
MIHSAKLDMERFTETPEIEFDVFSYFYDHGYPVDIEQLYNVVNQKPQEENSGYLVAEITTTQVPLDEADVASDEITKLTCSCPAYQYQAGVDLSDATIDDWKHCKHCEAVDPVAKAKADDNQTSL